MSTPLSAIRPAVILASGACLSSTSPAIPIMQLTYSRRCSRRRQSHFGLFVKSDRSCGMKRDGIPNNLYLLRRDASPLQKRARSIGAIHLETIFRRVAVSQAQIMQNRGYCQQLGIRSTFSAF